jgi:hypothetical protein
MEVIMKLHKGLAYIPLLLVAACGHSKEEPKASGNARSAEIREIPEEVRKALGVGPDDFVGAVASDGHLILYSAPGNAYREAEAPPVERMTSNQIKVRVYPPDSGDVGVNFIKPAYAASKQCIYVKDDSGNRGRWYPSPPCPK